MHRFCLLFIGIFTANAVLGQDFCNPNEWTKAGLATPNTGGFKILGSRAGCVPFKVNVEKTVGDNHQYIYTYKGGNPTKGYPLLTETNTIYIEAGSYKILQLGSNGSLSVSCDSVFVFTKPNFTKKECSGRRVVVSIPNDSINRRYDSFLVDWGDGTSPEKVAKSASMNVSRVYPNTSPRTITVEGVFQGQTINCELKASIPVIPSAVDISAVAVRRVTTRSDGFVDVKVNGVQGVVAELQMAKANSPDFVGTMQTISKNDTTTITVRGIDADKESFCFRMSANDGCENLGSSSNVVCSVSLEATAQNRQNALKWSEYTNITGFQNYKINRNNTTVSMIAGLLTTTYTDPNLVCGEQYCYQVVATVGNAESVSQLRCVKAISDETPSLVRNAYVSVLENQNMEIRAAAPIERATTYRYKGLLLKANVGSDDFREVMAKDNSLAFIDEDVNTASQSYCYKIIYENACGNRSEPTPAVCSILLESNGTDISWSPQKPFTVPVNRYVLEKLDDKGNLIDQYDLGGNTVFKPATDDPDQQLFTYRVLAFAQGNAGLSYSNFYIFKRNALLAVPDAFSPNGDNINDKFKVLGSFVTQFSLTIYNRWGNQIFYTDKLTEGWDGTQNGQSLLEGTYIYKIAGIDALGQSFAKSGTVLLLR